MLLPNYSEFTKPFVISGGPGAGKTTLMRSLSRLGAVTYDEVSRTLIERELRSPEPILPWTNLPAFAHLCFQEMEAQLKASLCNEQLSFVDRAIPDIVAYLKLGNENLLADDLVVPEGYQRMAFMCKPEASIYLVDDVRPHPFEEALEIHQLLLDTYRITGFTVLEVPWGTPEKRANWVLSHCETVIPEGV
ncbi:AAA family ATPase [Parasalinivibrio latis]|uniref:AAA family ATPase n=1 Tax=Parasalinivibrio latis TaxID=2952610 RepID=UPI0030E3B74F